MTARPSASSRPARSVLLADPDPGYRRASTDRFRSAGWGVWEAETCTDVLATLVGSRPSLLVLELAFADGTAADVLGFVRVHALPVRAVVLTACADPRLLAAAFACHPSAVLFKPFALPDLCVDGRTGRG